MIDPKTTLTPNFSPSANGERVPAAPLVPTTSDQIDMPKRPRRRRWRVLRVVLVVIVVWIVITGALCALVVIDSATDNPQPADVILVLGSGLNPNNTPGRALTRRSLRGAQLYAEGYAPVVICTGGYTERRARSEADACGELLRANGVPAEAILLEEGSRSTEENALNTQAILEANGWSRVLLVSDGYHLLRARWIFDIANMQVVGTGRPDAPLFRGEILRAVAREGVALQWQAFKTVFNLPFTYVPVF